MQTSFIAKKLEIKDEDLILMIPELYTSAAACFAIRVITNIWLCFSPEINSFKSEKGDVAKLSRTGFIYKQKG